MSNLRDRMHSATLGAHPDLDDLAYRARQTGQRIKRRRRSSAVVLGVASVASVALVGSSIYASTRMGIDHDTVVATQPPSGPDSSVTPGSISPTPNATTSVAKALAVALDEVAPGGVTRPVAGSDSADPQDMFAQVAWRPGSGGGAAYVQVNAQPRWPDADNSCKPFMRQCQSSTLGNGATLTTYVNADKGPASLFQTAVLIRKDRMRLVISQANGHTVSGQWKVSRGDLPLTRAQLVALVTSPVWDDVAAAQIQPPVPSRAGVQHWSVGGPEPSGSRIIAQQVETKSLDVGPIRGTGDVVIRFECPSGKITFERGDDIDVTAECSPTSQSLGFRQSTPNDQPLTIQMDESQMLSVRVYVQ